MEVGCHQFGNPFRTVNNLTAQLSIVESTQLGNDTIYHSWREHPILFENGTLTLQAVSRSRTRVRQLGQLLQLGGILGVVDVHADIGPCCHFEGIGHLKPMPTGHAESCQQLIKVGRAVGRAHLHRLLFGGEERVVSGEG